MRIFQEKSGKKTALRKLLQECFKRRQALVLSLISLLFGATINLLFPAAVRVTLQVDGEFSAFSHPLAAATLLITLFFFQGIAFYLRTYFFNVLGAEVAFVLRSRIFDGLLQRPISFFDQHNISELVTRFSSDTLLVQEALSQRLSVLIRYSIQVLFGIAFMTFISWQLTILIVLALPVIVGIALSLGKKLKRLSKEQQRHIGESNAVAEDLFQGIRALKIFLAEQIATRRYRAAAQEVLRVALLRTKVSSLLQSFVGFLMNAALVVLFLYGLSLVNESVLSAGDFAAFVLYGVIVAISFSFLVAGYAEFAQSLGAAERLFEYFDSVPQHVSGGTANISGNLRLESVSFSFPSRPEVEVLHNLSCNFPEGVSTAIVGPSGAGKTALASLLLRLYEPSHGNIFTGSTPFSEISPQSFWEHISFVPQDSLLFAFSIRENLQLANPNASEKDLREVCRSVNLLTFIEGLPNGFDTLVGPLGSQLSGGQRQRLSIARALLKNPKILILDEATSALDNDNERVVQEALSQLLPGRTIIVIAHRASTIEQCDRVIVLENGRVVHEGPSQKGEFRATPHMYGEG